MKKIIVLIALLFGMALIFPIANLFNPQPAVNPLLSENINDPVYAKAAKALAKCFDCHSPYTKMPFYASFPIAKDLIQKDIKNGLSFMNMVDALVMKKEVPVSEVSLAKVEQAIESNSMPPLPYLLMHWNNVLTKDDKANLMAWIQKVRSEHYMSLDAAPEFKFDALQPIPQSVKLDEKKVNLGKVLFHDKRLSKDNTLSCASCHALNKGGTDHEKTSNGVGGAVGPINSPTVYNSGLQFKQFWDGRAENLEEQAAGPVHNPIEMGSNWEEVIPKLSRDPIFMKEYLQVFPDGLTGKHITEAIAEFERSLITPNSRFDQYLRGNKQVLSEEEVEGYKLFKLHGCSICHVGKILGGQSFEKMGRFSDYFKKRGNVKDVDYGRFHVTKQDADKFKFKVPTLRNIEVTWPYFHDASTSDLKEAVKMMSAYQTEEAFTDAEAEKVAQFLKTLTGEYSGKKLA